MNKKYRIILFFILFLRSNFILSSISSDDEFGDIPDATEIHIPQSSINSLQHIACHAKPAWQAFTRTTVSAANTTAKVIAGAYSGAIAAVSEKPLEECLRCRQRQTAKISLQVKSNFYDNSDSDEEVDRYDYTTISPNRPCDAITKELEDKAKISALEKADLFQKINDYIKQTYTQDAHRLSNESIQRRINALIITSQQQSNITVGQDVSISKQTAQFYVQKQFGVLDRQLNASSQIEETAQITRDSNIKLAESRRAHAIEQIEKTFTKRKIKEEKKYDAILTKEYYIGQLIAQNTQHLYQRAEQEIPDITQLHHFQNIEEFQRLLINLRPKITTVQSEISLTSKSSKKK